MKTYSSSNSVQGMANTVLNIDPFLQEMQSIHASEPHTKGSSGAHEAAPISAPNTMGLTPEGLMAYCQSRLNSLDTQMSTIFNQQQSNAQLTQAVDGIASQLNDLGQTDPTDTSGNPQMNVTGSIADINAAYTQAIKEAKDAGNPQLAAQLNQDMLTLDGKVSTSSDGTQSIRGNDITNAQQNLKNYGNELNSDSEMSMINLQSLMSQRQTAIQLTTNLVQSLGQQSQDIAKNVGQ